MVCAPRQVPDCERGSAPNGRRGCAQFKSDHGARPQGVRRRSRRRSNAGDARVIRATRAAGTPPLRPPLRPAPAPLRRGPPSCRRQTFWPSLLAAHARDPKPRRAARAVLVPVVAAREPRARPRSQEGDQSHAKHHDRCAVGGGTAPAAFATSACPDAGAARCAGLRQACQQAHALPPPDRAPPRRNGRLQPSSAPPAAAPAPARPFDSAPARVSAPLWSAARRKLAQPDSEPPSS